MQALNRDFFGVRSKIAWPCTLYLLLLKHTFPDCCQLGGKSALVTLNTPNGPNKIQEDSEKIQTFELIPRTGLKQTMNDD